MLSHYFNLNELRNFPTFNQIEWQQRKSVHKTIFFFSHERPHFLRQKQVLFICCRSIRLAVLTTHNNIMTHHAINKRKIPRNGTNIVPYINFRDGSGSLGSLNTCIAWIKMLGNSRLVITLFQS